MDRQKQVAKVHTTMEAAQEGKKPEQKFFSAVEMAEATKKATAPYKVKKESGKTFTVQSQARAHRIMNDTVKEKQKEVIQKEIEQQIQPKSPVARLFSGSLKVSRRALAVVGAIFVTAVAFAQLQPFNTYYGGRKEIRQRRFEEIFLPAIIEAERQQRFGGDESGPPPEVEGGKKEKRPPPKSTPSVW